MVGLQHLNMEEGSKSNALSVPTRLAKYPDVFQIESYWKKATKG
jgi:hypothetical protein